MTPAEELARALSRFIDSAHLPDPWAKYPAVLGIHEVAEIMSIQPDSVSESARRGNLPMTKKLGRYVVAQDVFRSWLASREVA